MGEIVNLRRVRKAKARNEAEHKAAQNRVDHGLSKQQKTEMAALRQAQEKHLDLHYVFVADPDKSE